MFFREIHLPEINEFWSCYTLRTQDSVDPKYYSDAYLNEIRNDFFELADGAEFILDADGDTTLHANVDDTIDIKIAGADDFQFTANNFNVLSGSDILTL